MSVITITENGLVTKDPSDIKVYLLDWDVQNLAVGATITTSVFTITPGPGSPATSADLTQDNASILTGSRKTQVRLSGGTLGQQYEVTNRIVTNETPAQTKERSFSILVQNR